MSQDFFAYLGAILVCAVGGGLLRLFASQESNSSQILPVSFAGGILLGAAFFQMIPEVGPILGDALGWPLTCGFALIAALEHFFIVHPHPESPGAHGQQHHLHVGVAAAVGISFHSLLDGLAVAASFGKVKLSRVVLIAVVAHKVPEAFALTSLLLLDEWSRKATTVWLLVYALSTPVGAIIANAILRQATTHFLASAIAFSAGTFLAVAASDIVPRIQHQRSQDGRILPLLAFLGGLVVSWVAARFGQI